MQNPKKIQSLAADNSTFGQGRLENSTSLFALLLAMIFIAAGMPLLARASHFDPPSLDGFTPAGEQDVDGDADGVNETHIQKYHNAAGDSIYSMTTNGHVWAWSLETRGESNSGPRNYVIRDSDCDGIFDEVYGLNDEYYLPDCVKKQEK